MKKNVSIIIVVVLFIIAGSFFIFSKKNKEIKIEKKFNSKIIGVEDLCWGNGGKYNFSLKFNGSFIIKKCADYFKVIPVGAMDAPTSMLDKYGNFIGNCDEINMNGEHIKIPDQCSIVCESEDICKKNGK